MPASKINQQKIANQRLEAMRRVKLLQANMSAVKAAAAVGVSIPTLWRWKSAYAKHGLGGLETKLGNCGRRSPISRIKFSKMALRALETLIVESGSRRRAWKQFANHRECPPFVARLIRNKYHMPAFMVRLVRVRQMPGRCYISADGLRLFVKFNPKAT